MTTTENSRADALTEAQRRTLQSALDLFVAMGHAPGSDHVRTLAGMLAKPSSLQPAAAPIDDARECLMDVVSHHDNIVAGFAAQRLAAQEAQDSDSAAYWNHEIDVAHRMKAQAERALAAMAQPASSPADEQAAFNAWVKTQDSGVSLFDAYLHGKARALLAPLPDPAQVAAESPDWIKNALPPEGA